MRLVRFIPAVLAALVAALQMWVRVVGFVVLLAGVGLSMAVWLLYIPTAVAAGWVLVGSERTTATVE